MLIPRYMTGHTTRAYIMHPVRSCSTRRRELAGRYLEVAVLSVRRPTMMTSLRRRSSCVVTGPGRGFVRVRAQDLRASKSRFSSVVRERLALVIDVRPLNAIQRMPTVLSRRSWLRLIWLTTVVWASPSFTSIARAPSRTRLC